MVRKFVIVAEMKVPKQDSMYNTYVTYTITIKSYIYNIYLVYITVVKVDVVGFLFFFSRREVRREVI